MSDVPDGSPPRPEGGQHDGTPDNDGRYSDLHAQFRAARDGFERQAAQARGQFEEANERIKQRTGRDLLLAIVIGLAIGAVTLGSLIFLKWIFVVFALAVASLGVFELGRALQVSGRRIDLIPQFISVALLIVTGYITDLWLHWISLFAAIALVTVWRLVAQMITKDGRIYADVLTDVVVGAFVPVYVPFLASLALVLLRHDGGEWWVLAFLIVVIVADTGAYATGLMMGRHPMAPRISPKKTWEGFAGATVVSLIAGALLAAFMLDLPWWAGLVFGAVILATATAGDLGESMLKRDLGIKDMSSWLPGHGGVLDRLDSILPSATGALLLYHLLTPLAAL